MSTADIQLYAELLVNIRHVSVSVTLPTPVDETTAAELLPRHDALDGRTRLRVRHNGAVHEMTLPGNVAMAERAVRLPLPNGKGAQPTYLTWRLPVADTPAHSSSSDDDELAPWSAPDLQPRSRVACRTCEAAVVPARRIGVWKDLPSDNWAEMMEFWHCHKPAHTPARADGKAAEDTLAGRGYGANSVISAEAGVGYVDLITLLFAESDCEGLAFSESTFEHASDRDSILAKSAEDANERVLRGLNVYCASCRAQIGYYSLRTQSVNLFKWLVDCVSTPSSASASRRPSVADCVAATLVATIARTGSSKSVILPIYEVDAGAAATHEQVLQLWVLNSGICYATSTAAPRRAIKLLFKYMDRAAADDAVVRLHADVQEINLPRDTIAAVARQLEASNGLLPVRARAFKEWKIGLIARWV